MYVTRIVGVVAATAAAGIVCAAIVSADATTQTLGNQIELADGAVTQAWMISNLKPSTDTIPYRVSGTLWEATATDKAIRGSVTPIIPALHARARDGQTYPALFQVATPQGVNPATLAQGQQTAGKVYFDVTGTKPDSVVYIADGQALAVWTQAPSASRGGSPSSPYPSGSSPSGSPAEVAPEATPGAAEEPAAAPSAAGTEAQPLPEGSQGTPLPLPEGSQGTPLPVGAGVPAPGGAAPVAASVPPQPASQSGPVPAGTGQAPPTIYAPAPTP